MKPEQIPPQQLDSQHESSAPPMTVHHQTFNVDNKNNNQGTSSKVQGFVLLSALVVLIVVVLVGNFKGAVSSIDQKLVQQSKQDNNAIANDILAQISQNIRKRKQQAQKQSVPTQQTNTNIQPDGLQRYKKQAELRQAQRLQRLKQQAQKKQAQRLQGLKQQAQKKQAQRLQGLKQQAQKKQAQRLQRLKQQTQKKQAQRLQAERKQKQAEQAKKKKEQAQQDKKIKPLQQLQKSLPNAEIKRMSMQNAFKDIGLPFTITIKDDGKRKNIKEKAKQYGLDRRVQVGSEFDFLNLLEKVDFDKLAKDMPEAIAHETIRFKQDTTKKQDPLLNLQISEAQFTELSKQVSSYNEGNFGIKLTQNINDRRYRILQYLYYNNRYHIGNNKNQIPMCLFSASYNIYSKNRYKLFFESIARQNYSNYHIVYVDDVSPDESAYRIFEYLNETNTRVNSRITIVHNWQRMETLANMYFWTRKYCAPDSIVVIVDGDDSLMGTQTLQVLNSVYSDDKVWYAYSKYTNNYVDQGRMVNGWVSQRLNLPINQYRTRDLVWMTSHLRTFRQQLMAAVPLYHFVEYHYDEATEKGFPRFYGAAPDRYQVYTQLQMASQAHLHFINDALYLYDPNIGTFMRNCYREHQKYQEYKSRIKTPMKPMKSLNEKAQMLDNYQIPQNMLNSLGKFYQNRKKCDPDS